MFITSLTVHNFICYLLFQKKKQYSREEPWMSIYKHTWSATWPFSAYAELRNFWAWSLETWNNHSRHQLFSPDLLTFHDVGILRVLYMATIYDLEEHRRTDYVIKNYFLCFFFGYSISIRIEQVKIFKFGGNCWQVSEVREKKPRRKVILLTRKMPQKL